MDYLTTKVLVVDDDQTTRRIISRLVRQIGFDKPNEANDGAQAFEMLQCDTYGLVLSDWDMPNVNGLTLLEMVRSDNTLHEIPFIMITANDDRENIIKAAKAKVSQYIVKPFTVQALKSKIEKIIGPNTGSN